MFLSFEMRLFDQRTYVHLLCLLLRSLHQCQQIGYRYLNVVTGHIMQRLTTNEYALLSKFERIMVCEDLSGSFLSASDVLDVNREIEVQDEGNPESEHYQQHSGMCNAFIIEDIYLLFCFLIWTMARK